MACKRHSKIETRPYLSEGLKPISHVSFRAYIMFSHESDPSFWTPTTRSTTSTGCGSAARASSTRDPFQSDIETLLNFPFSLISCITETSIEYLNIQWSVNILLNCAPVLPVLQPRGLPAEERQERRLHQKVSPILATFLTRVGSIDSILGPDLIGV